MGQINPQDVWTENKVHLACPVFHRHPLHPISQHWPELYGLFLRPPRGLDKISYVNSTPTALGGVSSIGRRSKKV